MANTSRNTSPSVELDEVSPQRMSSVPPKSYIVGKYNEMGALREPGRSADDQHTTTKLVKLLNSSMITRGGQLLPGFVMTPEGPMREADLAKRGYTLEAPAPAAQSMKASSVKNGKLKAKSVKAKDKQKAPDTSHGTPDQHTTPATIPVAIPVAAPPLITQLQPQLQTQLQTQSNLSETFPVVFVIESGTIKSMADAVLETDTAVILVYRDDSAISYLPKAGNTLQMILPSNSTVQVMYLGIKSTWYASAQQLLVFMKVDLDENEE